MALASMHVIPMPYHIMPAAEEDRPPQIRACSHAAGAERSKGKGKGAVTHLTFRLRDPQQRHLAVAVAISRFLSTCIYSGQLLTIRQTARTSRTLTEKVSLSVLLRRLVERWPCPNSQTVSLGNGAVQYCDERRRAPRAVDAPSVPCACPRVLPVIPPPPLLNDWYSSDQPRRDQNPTTKLGGGSELHQLVI